MKQSSCRLIISFIYSLLIINGASKLQTSQGALLCLYQKLHLSHRIRPIMPWCRLILMYLQSVPRELVRRGSYGEVVVMETGLYTLLYYSIGFDRLFWLWSFLHVVFTQTVCALFAPCGLRGCKNGPAPFPGRMSYKATKPALVFVLYLSMFFIVLVFIRAPFYVLLVFIVCVLSFGCSS